MYDHQPSSYFGGLGAIELHILFIWIKLGHTMVDDRHSYRIAK